MLLALALLQAAIAIPTPAATAPADGDKLVCRRVQATGSRMAGKRTCMTQRQWVEQAAARGNLLDTSSQRR